MAVTTANFINKYELTLTDFNSAKLTAYIARYETITLIELFGKELYDLYVTGIAGGDSIYETLRDAFTVQLSSGLILDSKGVDDMLTGIIYFYYSRDINTQQTSNGNVSSKGENSERVNEFKANIQSRWSEANDTYWAIQYYILENSSVYPTFEGYEPQNIQMF
jgi:hypothetical protein